MQFKFSHALLWALVIILFSCNTKEEKKSDNSSVQPNNTLQETQAPANDVALLEDRVAQDSLNIELRTMLAAKYYSTGNFEKAHFHFMKIYELDNNNLIALANLGNLYYDTQQDDKAIQFYEKALVIDPSNINMKCDLATCYSRINKFKKAIEILNGNIKMDYNHLQSHYNLSIILKQTGNTKEADEEMKIYQKLSSGVK